MDKNKKAERKGHRIRQELTEEAENQIQGLIELSVQRSLVKHMVSRYFPNSYGLS